MTHDELDIFTKTIYGEARGEPLEGKRAVACVILNRVKKPCWWGKDITSVCLKSYRGIHQFSCWNANDPNYLILTEKDLSGDIVYRQCKEIAEIALRGEIKDETGGATHYLTEAGIKAAKWDDGKTPCAQIGRHYFFKDI